MAHETMKSSLWWSIGGVGLLVGGIVGLSYWSHHPQDSASQLAERTLSPGPSSSQLVSTAADPWERAMDFGWQAAVKTQTATTVTHWRQVEDLWLKAIAELEQVPQSAPQQPQVQAKIQEYLANFDYATAEKMKARSTASVSTGLVSSSRFQAILADGPMKAQFSPPSQTSIAGQAVVTGTAVDEQTRIELISQADQLTQVTLALTHRGDLSSLTMTNLVYTHHVIASAVPDEVVPKRWLADGLKHLDTKPHQPISETFGAYQISLSRDIPQNQIYVAIAPMKAQ
jgi:hypothetical protein